MTKRCKIFLTIFFFSGYLDLISIPLFSVDEVAELMSVSDRVSGEDEVAGETSSLELSSDEEGVIQGLNEKLYEAARAGNLSVVLECLFEGADVNAEHLCCWTALHIAVQEKHYNIVQILLRFGADINAQEVTLWTPLHIAAHAGDRKAVKILLNAGARKDIRNLAGQTPAKLAHYREDFYLYHPLKPRPDLDVVHADLPEDQQEDQPEDQEEDQQVLPEIVVTTNSPGVVPGDRSAVFRRFIGLSSCCSGDYQSERSSASSSDSSSFQVILTRPNINLWRR